MIGLCDSRCFKGRFDLALLATPATWLSKGCKNLTAQPGESQLAIPSGATNAFIPGCPRFESRT